VRRQEHHGGVSPQPDAQGTVEHDVEHWDVLQIVPDVSANDNGMF